MPPPHRKTTQCTTSLASRGIEKTGLAKLNLAGAEAFFFSVIERHPEDAAARRNRAQVRLLQGQFQQGWIDFEYRFQTGTREHYPPGTLWRGEPIAEKKLLVHFE